jgi:hypothetical protein
MALGVGVIGESFSASIAYAITGTTGMVANVPITVNMLQTMLSGVGMDKKGKSIIQFVKVSNYTAVYIYAICLFTVFTFLPFYTAANPDEAPNESIIIPALLVLRNMSVALLFIVIALISVYTGKKVRVVIASRSSAGTSGKSSGAGEEKMKAMLEKLDAISKDNMKKGIVVGTLYLFWSLPFMHPYQVRQYIFLLLLGTRRGLKCFMVMFTSSIDDRTQVQALSCLCNSAIPAINYNAIKVTSYST